MFLNRFCYIPLAAQTCWERDKIALTKRGGGTAINGSDCHFPAEEIARFIFAIAPGKLSGKATPCSPKKDTFFSPRNGDCHETMTNVKISCRISNVFIEYRLQQDGNSPLLLQKISIWLRNNFNVGLVQKSCR